jgi:hypothetical protein
MEIKYKLLILTCTCFILASSLTATAQNLKVSGVVSDARTNELLMGVTVMVKGTSNGTTTGADGKYTLTVSENDTIEAIMMGIRMQPLVKETQRLILPWRGYSYLMKPLLSVMEQWTKKN